MRVKRAHIAAALLALLAIFAIAACGGSDSDGGEKTSAAPKAAGQSDQLADANAVLKEAMREAEWNGPDDSPAVAEGKFVVNIPCSQSASGCSRPGDGFTEAAKALGWKTQLIDPAGDAGKYQTAIQQASRLGADGVFAQGGSEAQVGKVLPGARDAGLSLVSMQGNQDQAGPESWNAVINNDYSIAGPALASYVAVNSDNAGKVLVIDNSEYPNVHNGTISFEENLEKYCPGCEVVETMDFSIQDIGTSYPSRIKATLQANPEIDWIFAPYDFAGIPVVTAVKELGRQDEIKMVSADGNPENLQLIKKGEVQAASFALASEWIGYLAADTLNRVFQNEEVPADEDGYLRNYGTKLIDSTNLPADLSVPWDGDVDFRAKFKEAWGLNP